MTGTRTAGTLPDATRLGRTALRVADLDEALSFYRDVVGLSVLTEDEATATLGAGEEPVLVLDAAGDLPRRGRNETGLYHNAFRVPSRGALGDALSRVREHWRLDGATDHAFSEALYLADPEGNGVEIYRDRPRDDWPFDDGRLRPDESRPLDLDALAADAAGESAAPSGTDLGHVHLEVSSVPDAKAFYAGTLGFETTMELPPSAAFLSAGGYHHHVGVNTWNGRSEPAAGRGLAWFEVVLPDGDALEAARERLTGDGRSVSETAGGIAVEDPDGIELRLRVEG